MTDTFLGQLRGHYSYEMHNYKLRQHPTQTRLNIQQWYDWCRYTSEIRSVREETKLSVIGDLL